MSGCPCKKVIPLPLIGKRKRDESNVVDVNGTVMAPGPGAHQEAYLNSLGVSSISELTQGQQLYHEMLGMGTSAYNQKVDTYVDGLYHDLSFPVYGSDLENATPCVYTNVGSGFAVSVILELFDLVDLDLADEYEDYLSLDANVCDKDKERIINETLRVLDDMPPLTPVEYTKAGISLGRRDFDESALSLVRSIPGVGTTFAFIDDLWSDNPIAWVFGKLNKIPNSMKDDIVKNISSGLKATVLVSSATPAKILPALTLAMIKFGEKKWDEMMMELVGLGAISMGGKGKGAYEAAKKSLKPLGKIIRKVIESAKK